MKTAILLVAYGTSSPQGRGSLRQFDAWVRERFPGICVRWALSSELLRTRHERGEIRAIDYERAAEVLMCMMLHHVTAKLLGISPTKLDYPEKRRTLICYQTNLWKNVSSPDKTNMQNL